jgi:AraC-like DNA-binding protein
MNRIRTFLGEHTEETLTLRELSAMASMSRSHFSHTFHVVLGMSLRDYVRDLRLQRTHLLLLAFPLSLTAIAAESGFYDLPHLDKAFRHRLGVSPLEFRRRYNTRAHRRLLPQFALRREEADGGQRGKSTCLLSSRSLHPRSSFRREVTRDLAGQVTCRPKKSALDGHPTASPRSA